MKNKGGKAELGKLGEKKRKKRCSQKEIWRFHWEKNIRNAIEGKTNLLAQAERAQKQRRKTREVVNKTLRKEGTTWCSGSEEFLSFSSQKGKNEENLFPLQVSLM